MSQLIEGTIHNLQERLDEIEWFRENFENLIQEAFDAGLQMGYDTNYDVELFKETQQYLKEKN